MVPGTGHQKAAEAIMKAAAQMDPRVECVGVDAASRAYPFIGTVFNRMYLEMLKRVPLIWDYLYDNPDVEAFTRDARGLLTLISSFRTQKIIKKYRPQALICTQAIPATAFAAEKRRGRLKIPLIGVVTDFGVHAYWLHQEIDLYLVAHEDIKKNMVERGISSDRIRVTGIPIDPKFGEMSNVSDMRKRIKINPRKKTVLLMGGSRGMGDMTEMIHALQCVPVRFQTLVVCGRNKRLYRKIKKLTKGLKDFKIFGYVKEPSNLMGAADLLITKPGGLTCSEALAKQLPLILTNPIPGQEERNVKFLTQRKAACLAQTPDETAEWVKNLLRQPKKLKEMKQRARLLSRPLAAWEAARLIFDVIHSRGAFAKNLDFS